eukprot:CAMPEP_0119006998 /NCGR_PEP_ID=MMETSP1176-20130426/2699_1 /TAXON_ID=265551 /ORGANISM="Synedropsis recta cf, Strain CCMP1620" /LENGTH=130 /DNA_ID=CAMNT_0006959047 /DNA_START=13 /DNA_END=402 /DNA_ORIENTATION=-
MAATLTTQDVRDIQSSFAVMDVNKTELIDMEGFYTLWLGLGYSRNMSKQDLAVYIPQHQHEAITLNNVLTICSRHSRDSESEIATSFQLLDSTGSGCIRPSDLVTLAKDMGDSLTLEEAQCMIGDGKEGW